MKILAIERLEEAARREREQGKRVVFTNGCFDVLHPGHIYCLCEARALGDVLFVGLNSDTSVRALKGSQRPVFPENERAELLASVSCVDYIVVFSEETPLRIIKMVRPDVLVKGGDYAEEQVVGCDFVESHGGRLVIIPPLEGFSSSSILKRINIK